MLVLYRIMQTSMKSVLDLLQPYFNCQYYIFVDCGTSALEHVREVVDGLNATDKNFIYYLMATVKISGSKGFDTKMLVNTATQNTDLSLAQKDRKTLVK